DVAQLGPDQRLDTVASRIGRLALPGEILEVIVERVAHRVGAVFAMGAVRAFLPRLPRRILRLPEVEDTNAVGIGHVVGGADALDFVLLIADIMPGHPSARLATTEAAVA